MTTITVNVFSPWGSSRRLKLGVDKDCTVQEFKDLLIGELDLEASDVLLELQVEGEDFGRDLTEGKLADNGVVTGSEIHITSVEIEHGTNVKKSDASKNKNLTEDPWDDNAPEWKRHEKGLNYEGLCPNSQGKRVIIPRGCGVFDFLVDPVDLKCPCCLGTVDPRTVQRAAVNQCQWSWEGILDSGEKLNDKGSTPKAYYWILNQPKTWRKLIIRAIDPFAPQQQNVQKIEMVSAINEAVDDNSFVCSLCKNSTPNEEHREVAGRSLCIPCSEKISQALAERQKRREEEEAMKKKERGEKIEKVALPGLGEQVTLKKVTRLPDDS